MRAPFSLKEALALRRAKLRSRREADVRARAERYIQAREAGGKLYLAVGGEPVVAADDLRKPLPEALADARAAWREYMLRTPKDTMI